MPWGAGSSGIGARLRLRHLARLADVRAQEWDALFDAGYPFTRHAFLHALEDEGCVGAESGWEPWHLVAEDERGSLIGAAPLYRKAHSYGEFVFDFAWARASHQLGRRYYPKLVNAIPFVPAVGPRLGAHDATVRLALAERLAVLPAQQRLSSLHALFVDDAGTAAWRDCGLLERHDIQFQWEDRGYGDFAGFAAQLASDKRKKLLRERRRVAEAGIAFRVRRGTELDDAEWEHLYRLYASTYHERGQEPYFTPAFLVRVGRDPQLDMRVVCAFHGAEWVAVAISFAAGATLYGRHWGAMAHYHSLHFECCYYQGIELCLREGLKRFDAGTQGAHKHGRGFDPVQTRSFHVLADPALREAVKEYLLRERSMVAAHTGDLMHHTPYRDTGCVSRASSRR